MTMGLFDGSDPSAEASVRAMINGALRTQALYVAAVLGVADELTFGPKPIADVARRVGADAMTLARVLRLLVGAGVFVECAVGHFGLSPAAEYLQTGHPRSLRPSAIRAGERMWAACGGLLDLVRNGPRSANTAPDLTFFDRLIERNEHESFHSRMSATAASIGDAIAAQDCVRRAQRVVDVGGGLSGILVPVLRAHPDLRCVLLDRPETCVGAAALFRREGLSDRCEVREGSFFDVLPQGDLFLLSWVLHDWPDEVARQILAACVRAGGAKATLLVVEVLRPSPAAVEQPSAAMIDNAFVLDLHMLLLTGGRERTAEEFDGLLRSVGYTITKISTPPTARNVSIVEACPALV